MTYDCMTADEYRLWAEQNARAQAMRPCTDCTMAYHLQEKAAGRCDRVPQPNGGKPGTPGRKAQWRAAARRYRAGRSFGA